MGKLALFLILSATGALIYHGASTGRGRVGSASQAAEVQRSALARAAAKTGWARAKQDLAGGLSDFTVQGANGSATYEVTATVVAADEVTVVSVGRVPVPGSLKATGYTLSYRLRAVGSDELPEFAQQAVVVEGDFTITGNGTIVSPGVTSGTNADVPLRVHANGHLHSGSSSVRVAGFGTYTTSVSGKLSSTFQPGANPDGAAALSQRDSVHVPTIDTADVLATHGGADVTYPSLPVPVDVMLINRTLPGGTRDNPRVYYVDGGALLQDVRFDGYAVFVATGQIEIAKSVTGTPDAGTNESALAVITPGEITMGGGTDVRGALFAGSGVGYNGNVDVWGNVMVGGDFDQGGGAAIHYVPPAPSLFGTWADSDPALRLLAYREQ